MDRREFLKTLGLGGLAITLPKPLEVIAAKMADISGMPVHVGLARFRGIRDFTFEDVGIVYDGWQIQNHLSPERYRDLMEKWAVHVAIRWGDNAYEKISIRPMKNSLFCVRSHGPEVKAAKPSFRVPQTATVEVWAAPEGKPLFPLPPLTVSMYGPFLKTLPRDYASLAMRSVRLERARAIELGLASPSDPFEMV